MTTDKAFLELLYEFFDRNGRMTMPWRSPRKDGSFDPYAIMVSEVMLQQTQVSRVTPKYALFLTEFPDVDSLAATSLGDVLRVWSGLGYNRRAKYLWQSAIIIRDKFNGQVPTEVEDLTGLPGIGHNTAGAIRVYATNNPVVFVETNIRSVIINHFFGHWDKVSDKEIAQKVASLLTGQDPRTFYWAMMDYGSHLKASGSGLLTKSVGHTTQSTFKGSRRQIRGQILKLLGKNEQTIDDLRNQITDNRLSDVINELMTEGFVVHHGQSFRLP